MPAWWDSLFGDVPTPQPQTGYQAMPDMIAPLEDRRQPAANVFPSRPHDLNWGSRRRPSPFPQIYNRDQWNWLQGHMPPNPSMTQPPNPTGLTINSSLGSY